MNINVLCCSDVAAFENLQMTVENRCMTSWFEILELLSETLNSKILLEIAQKLL